MKRGKKAVSILLAVFSIIITVAANPNVVKAETAVPQMDIYVTINDDGSATITQVWDTYMDEGTEMYLYQKDSGYLGFSDLMVRDDKKEYTNIGEWDIDADFDEKAYKCGINEVDDGVELCWGISEYGENHYEITYTLDNLIRAYDDADGCLYRFVNPIEDFFPTDVCLTISMANETFLDENNARIWGFGYDGEVYFEDGSVVAYTNQALSGDANITLMIGLDQGIIEPDMQVDEAFEDVIDYALEDSDYIDEQFEEDDDLWILGVFAAFIALIAGVFGIAVAIENKKIRKMQEEAPYFYAVPNNGNINATYVLGKSVKACKEDSLFGARITRLMMSGAAEVKDDDLEEYEGMRNLYLNPSVYLEDEFDRELFDILCKAADENHMLKPKKLKKYCEKHYKKIEKYIKKCEKDGELYLEQYNCLKDGKFKSYSSLNEKGMQQLYQV